MITVRPANARGTHRPAWGLVRHAFSCGDYMDREWHHFRSLRMLDEQVIQPGTCTPVHEHRDLEVLTWVLEGTLQHHHGLGMDSDLLPTDGVQLLRYGIGMEHQECNISGDQSCRLLRFGVIPTQPGGPGQAQDHVFPAEARRNRLQLLASPDGSDHSLLWGSEAKLHVTCLDIHNQVSLDLPQGRAAWVQVARGRVEIMAEGLLAGDGAALVDEPVLTLTATQPSLVFVLEL